MDIDPPPPSNVPEKPEAPDKEKMDQIRAQRLAKLGGGRPTPKKGLSADGAVPPTPSTPVSGPSTPISKPKINITKMPASSSSSSTANPFNKLTPSGKSTPTVSTQPPKRARPDTESEAQSPPLRKPSVPITNESISAYEDRILGMIFRITLDPKEKTDSQNHRLIFLPNQVEELAEDGLPLLLTRDRLDAVIMEAASTIPNDKAVLDYLLPCWKRVVKVQKGLRGYASEKDAILKEAKRLCMSYCIFAVEMPDLFGRNPNPATDSLTPYLLHDPTDDRGICPDFLTEAVLRFEEDDSVKLMLRKAVAGLSLQLSSMTMNDNYKPYVQALKQVCQFTPVVTALAEDSLFQMATSAPGIEVHTLLGPFFRISPLQTEVTREYFASPKTLDKRRVQTSQEALRLTLQTHQKDLLDIINYFVRAGVTSRNRTLDWFAYVVNSNHMRRALRPDATTLSSDGFLINFTVVLDGLCEPFMDSTFSKVSKIDFDYLRRRPRVDIKEETKLNADQNASEDFYSTVVEGSSNFISEIFFLTLAAHHYGSEATNGMLKSLEKDIKYLKEKVEQLEAEKPKFLNSPGHLARFEEQLRRFNDVLEKAMSLRFAVEGVLFDKQMQTKSLQFMRYVTVWLLRVATQSDYTPDKSIQLPLSAQMPDQFKFLPEYVLEDIVGNFNFVLRFMPDLMISAVGDELVALCVTFLTNSEYIKNPYLKAKLVSMLYQGSYPVYHRAKGVLGDSLTSTTFANDHLLHALMKFYIEVEQTGAHTQFYDKFNIRYEIFQVIKCIWTNDIYRQRLTQESRTNTQFFLRFVNLLLNDATFVLDEALSKFPKIHDLQIELTLPQTPALTPEQRTTKEEELATAEGQATSYMQLTNETVSMMKLFTGNLSASFTMPEIVDRVAAMVDYTLDTIVGPKSANLKVENAKKYQFDPKLLLSEFVDIYLNLSVSENFIEAVARDGRSYKPDNFDSATRILRRHALKSGEEIARWEILKGRFKAAKEAEDQDEEDLADAPDEYLDPLLASLMLDPVILPTSRQTIDRSTIMSHLLSDQLDPFNRQPLRIEEVIENVELKAEIMGWREGKRREAREKRAAAAVAVADGGAMDLS